MTWSLATCQGNNPTTCYLEPKWLRKICKESMDRFFWTHLGRAGTHHTTGSFDPPGRRGHHPNHQDMLAYFADSDPPGIRVLQMCFMICPPPEETFTILGQNFKTAFTPLNLVQSSPFDLKNDQQDRAHLLKATCIFFMKTVDFLSCETTGLKHKEAYLA